MGLLSHTWIGCFLAFLPGEPRSSCGGLDEKVLAQQLIGVDCKSEGPPRINFNNAQFRLFPVDKTNMYCPEILPDRDVGFYYYSREFPGEFRSLRIGDDLALASSGLDLKLPTVIYFPAFFDGYDSTNVQEVKEAYLQKGGHNFIVVNSPRLNAGPWYLTAVTNTLAVGKYAAAFVDYLLLRGLHPKNLHFVGLSIGAHRAGIAARNMRLGKPARITGLDPASWFYIKKYPYLRLDKSDADLVDVIHTDRIFGIFYPIGRADFFVDADVYPQPGCALRDIFGKSQGILFAIFCSHLRSNKLFALSVVHERLFPGRKCYPKLGLCRTDSVEFMGPKTTSGASGIYLVQTRSNQVEVT